MLRLIFESLALCGVGLGLVLLFIILLSLVLRMLGFERVRILPRIVYLLWGGVAFLVILAALAGCGGIIPDRQAATSAGSVPTLFASCSQVISSMDVCDNVHGWRHVQWSECEHDGIFDPLGDIPDDAIYTPAPDLGADCDHPTFYLESPATRWDLLCHDNDGADYCDSTYPSTPLPIFQILDRRAMHNDSRLLL